VLCSPAGLRRPSFLLLSAALALAASAAGAAARSTLTAADTALARSALLVGADVGPGWSSQPAPAKVPPLTCTAFTPSLNGVVETGAAASRTFAQSSSGPFASSVAYVYKTAGQAAEVWHRAVTHRLLTCVADSLVGGSGHGVKFTVDRKHTMSLPPIAAGVRGYRVIGTASSSNQQVGVYLDVIVLERGRMLAALSYSTFLVPAERSLELRLARKVARRLVN
jgi:hypothetical protein